MTYRRRQRRQLRDEPIVDLDRFRELLLKYSADDLWESVGRIVERNLETVVYQVGEPGPAAVEQIVDDVRSTLMSGISRISGVM